MVVPWNTTPPPYRPPETNIPSLLFSWWATGFSIAIILTRVCGRKVRSNVLFREDRIMLAAVIPLLIRMGLVHVVLLYDTNNIDVAGQHLSATEIRHRSIGARLVLAARIFYAMYVWTCKLTISEFLKRITLRIWRRSYEVTLQGIRIFIFVTFGVVVIATLAECLPFDHYWKVVPQAPPRCRDGYAQLVAMGACGIIIDVLLVVFPVPIVIRSGQTWKRKFQLASLFSLSVIMIGVTATRVPKVISHQGRQQYRSVWASCEIVAATAVSNAVVVGSFLRDKGTKRNKYKSHSVADSIDRPSTRRPTVTTLDQYASDEDLFHTLGMRVPEHLRDEEEPRPRPAPAALPAPTGDFRRDSHRMPDFAILKDPPAAAAAAAAAAADGDRHEEVEDPIGVAGPAPVPSPKPSTRRSASFFDVGGLLEDSKHSSESRSPSTTLVDSSASGTIAYDFARTPEQSRRGSRVFLQDLGGIVPPSAGRPAAAAAAGGPPHLRLHSDTLPPLARARNGAPIGVLVPMLERHETQNSLQDAGGLLADADAVSLRHLRPGSEPAAAPGSAQWVTEQSLRDVGGRLLLDEP